MRIVKQPDLKIITIGIDDNPLLSIEHLTLIEEIVVADKKGNRILLKPEVVLGFTPYISITEI